MAEFQAARVGVGVGVPHISPLMKKAGFRTPQGEVGAPHPHPEVDKLFGAVRWEALARLSPRAVGDLDSNPDLPLTSCEFPGK